jgi:hypothetical protein
MKQPKEVICPSSKLGDSSVFWFVFWKIVFLEQFPVILLAKLRLNSGQVPPAAS